MGAYQGLGGGIVWEIGVGVSMQVYVGIDVRGIEFVESFGYRCRHDFGLHEPPISTLQVRRPVLSPSRETILHTSDSDDFCVHSLDKHGLSTSTRA